MRAALAAVLLLAGCGAEPDEVAPPALTLQPISYSDIEANDLHGASCAYASGTSMAPVALAMPDEAVIKIEGAIVRLGLDPQSQPLEAGTGSRYRGGGRVLDLSARPGSRAGDLRFEGAVRLSDDQGADLFRAQGAVQCTLG
ncbi:hypothetical protein [Tsuneonella sp. HG222]